MDAEPGSRRAYQGALETLDALEHDLQAGDARQRSRSDGRGEQAAFSLGDGAGFLEGVRRAKDYIAAGDIFQVVLSRQARLASSLDPFAIYRALRMVNPSPYMYFLKDGDAAIAGASPEMLVRVEGGRVEARPIAGTRPRGGSAAEDERLAAEMLADAKERAEHLMLVDLARNDLGRVSTRRPSTRTSISGEAPATAASPSFRKYM